MATTLSITIPTSATTRVVNAICQHGNYSDTLPDGSPNPQTKAQFAKAWVVNQIKQAVILVENYNASVSTQTDISNIGIT